MWARGLRSDPPADPPPTFGLYLLGRPPPATSWEQRWARWPDFRLPADRPDALAAIREAWERAGAEDERVEVACHGGTGRTGTALAVMAVLSGIAPREAVAWVRQSYRPRAVETPGQRRWVAGLDL